MNEHYVQGFIDKCAAAGVDPEALLKESAIPSSLTPAPSAGGDPPSTMPGPGENETKAQPNMMGGGLSRFWLKGRGAKTPKSKLSTEATYK